MVTFATDANNNAPLYYIAITITSPSSSSNFQQRVTINSNTNSSYYASNLKNVCFQDGAGNLLKSWLESGETNTSTASNYWVKIPTGSTTTIYQVLVATSSNSMDGSNTGAEPNYTGTYGQYDNGANVFVLYDNFPGSSLNARWTVVTNAPTYTVSNGFTATKTGSTQGTAIYDSGVSVSYATYDVDFYGSVFQTGSNPTAQLGLGTSAAGTVNWNLIYGQSSTVYGSMWNSGGSVALSTISTSSSNAIWTIAPTSSSSTTYYINYGGAQTGSTDAPTYPLIPALLAYGNTSATYSNSVFVQWYRLRLQPSSDTMPSTSAAAIASISASCTTDTIGSTANSSIYENSNIFVSPVTAGGTGDLQTIGIYLATAAGNVRVAIYSNSGSTPGSLIVQSASVAAVNGWNNISMPAASIVSGTAYWLAFQVSSNSTTIYYSSSGTSYQTVAGYGTFPSTLSGLGSFSGTFYMEQYYCTYGPPLAGSAGVATSATVTTQNLATGSIGIGASTITYQPIEATINTTATVTAVNYQTGSIGIASSATEISTTSTTGAIGISASATETNTDSASGAIGIAISRTTTSTTSTAGAVGIAGSATVVTTGDSSTGAVHLQTSASNLSTTSQSGSLGIQTSAVAFNGDSFSGTLGVQSLATENPGSQTQSAPVGISSTGSEISATSYSTPVSGASITDTSGGNNANATPPITYCYAFGPITATSSGNLSSVGINVEGVPGGSPMVAVAIYGDSGGAPSGLLAQSSAVSVTSTGWMDIPVTGVNIIEGNVYWFGYEPTGAATTLWVYFSTVTYYYNSQPFPSTTFSGSGTSGNFNMRMTYTVVNNGISTSATETTGQLSIGSLGIQSSATEISSESATGSIGVQSSATEISTTSTTGAVGVVASSTEITTNATSESIGIQAAASVTSATSASGSVGFAASASETDTTSTTCEVRIQSSATGTNFSTTSDSIGIGASSTTTSSETTSGEVSIQTSSTETDTTSTSGSIGLATTAQVRSSDIIYGDVYISAQATELISQSINGIANVSVSSTPVNTTMTSGSMNIDTTGQAISNNLINEQINIQCSATVIVIETTSGEIGIQVSATTIQSESTTGSIGIAVESIETPIIPGAIAIQCSATVTTGNQTTTGSTGIGASPMNAPPPTKPIPPFIGIQWHSQIMNV